MRLAQKLAVAVTGISVSLIAIQAKSVEAASLDYGTAFQATGVDTARNLFGLDGTGVKIGVISNSFNTSTSYDKFGRRDTYETNIANGYLPPGIQVLQDNTGSDEGRAILELVHTVAPGASLVFHSGSSRTESGPDYFAKAVQALKDAGANIIVDDLEYYNPPYNTFVAPTGPIDQAIQSVFNQGVAYFTSAGNRYRRNPEPPIFNFKNDPNALTVGAVYEGNDLISPSDQLTQQGQLEPFTSIAVPPYIKPDISAPDGLNISFNLNKRSRVDGDAFSVNDSVTGFYNFYGTSAAAPFSAAAAALIRQAIPNATPSEIYSALRDTAKPLDPNQPGFNPRSGYGLIQLDKALLALGARPLQVPENSSSFTLLTLGILGAGLQLKRHQQQKVLEKG